MPDIVKRILKLAQDKQCTSDATNRIMLFETSTWSAYVLLIPGISNTLFETCTRLAYVLLIPCISNSLFETCTRGRLTYY